MMAINTNDLHEFVHGGKKINISSVELQSSARSKKTLEALLKKGEIMYGINTGFGDLAHVRISDNDVKKLQKNIVLSHSVGSGPAIEKEYAKGALILKLFTFLKGYSAVSPQLLKIIQKMVERDIIPVTYETGSLGASGDLIPLAHMFATLYGKGDFYHKNTRINAKKGLELLNIPQGYDLDIKEGLAVTNGMQFSASVGGLSLYKLKKMISIYLDSFILFSEILNANYGAFDMDLQRVRPFDGSAIVFSYLNKNITSKKNKRTGRVQDAYTIRCIPQILGGIIDNLLYLQKELEIEYNSVSDNPLFVWEKKKYISGGNFHGQAIGIALDSAAISVSILTSLFERQVNRLVNSGLSGLPSFLIKDAGLNSGLMILQYSMAAIANKNAVLASPASIYNIPVSADQEDFVSMAGNSAIKFKYSVNNLAESLALFTIAVSQASNFKKEKLSSRSQHMKDELAAFIKPYKKDVYLKDDMEKVKKYINEKILSSNRTLF